MNLRWLMLDYVDPQLPLTGRERRKIWWRAYNATWRKQVAKASPPTRYEWVAFLVQGLAPAVCMLGSLLTWLYAFHLAIAAAFPVMVTGFIIGWLVASWLGRFTWKRHVNISLRAMGYDICPRCGYWLRGLDENVRQCPECGARRETPSAENKP